MKQLERSYFFYVEYQVNHMGVESSRNAEVLQMVTT